MRGEFEGLWCVTLASTARRKQQRETSQKCASWVWKVFVHGMPGWNQAVARAIPREECVWREGEQEGLSGERPWRGRARRRVQGH